MDNAAGYHPLDLNPLKGHPELVEGCIPGNRREIDTDLARRIQRRVDNLPPKLQAHIARAQEVARELAPYHNVPPEQAALGILAHDVARAMPGPELLQCAAQFALPIGIVDRRVPVLLHGPVGAEILRREEGLAAAGDNGCGELYQAVYWHTTAHPGLDDMGKVVFLADKLDPNKLKKYPYQPLIMELARENLDAALLEFLTRQIVELTGRGLLVHPMMVKTRNALLAAGAAD